MFSCSWIIIAEVGQYLLSYNQYVCLSINLLYFLLLLKNRRHNLTNLVQRTQNFLRKGINLFQMNSHAFFENKMTPKQCKFFFISSVFWIFFFGGVEGGYFCSQAFFQKIISIEHQLSTKMFPMTYRYCALFISRS